VNVIPPSLQQQQQMYQPPGFIPQGELMQLSATTGTLTRAPQLQFHNYNHAPSMQASMMGMPQFQQQQWPVVNSAIIGGNNPSMLMMMQGINANVNLLQHPVPQAPPQNKMVVKRFTTTVPPISQKEFENIQSMSIGDCLTKSFNGVEERLTKLLQQSTGVISGSFLGALKEYVPQENSVIEELLEMFPDVNMEDESSTTPTDVDVQKVLSEEGIVV
jgi:hypothetical protein